MLVSQSHKNKYRPRVNGSISAAALFSHAGILILYFSIYWKDALSAFVPSTFFIVGTLAGTTLLFSISIKSFMKADLLILWVVFSLLLTTTIKSGSFSFSNYLLAPIVAYFAVVADRGILIKLLIFHLYLSVAIQAYETFTGAYLFTFVASGGEELSVKLFGGSIGIFRAKGMFQGPLSAVAFGLWAAIILRGLRYRILGFTGAVFANGKLGILLIGILTIRTALSKRRVVGKALVVLVLLVAAAVLFRSLLATKSGAFFISAFDLTSSTNSARIYFWVRNFQAFLNFNFMSQLLGDLGYARQSIGSSENDFLRILLDDGLLGIGIYILVLISMFRSMKKSSTPYTRLDFSIIVIAMAFFPFIQSLNSTFLFWVLFWSLRHNRIPLAGSER